MRFGRTLGEHRIGSRLRDCWRTEIGLVVDLWRPACRTGRLAGCKFGESSVVSNPATSRPPPPEQLECSQHEDRAGTKNGSIRASLAPSSVSSLWCNIFAAPRPYTGGNLRGLRISRRATQRIESARGADRSGASKVHSALGRSRLDRLGYRGQYGSFRFS